jgi:hypothetical protein
MAAEPQRGALALDLDDGRLWRGAEQAHPFRGRLTDRERARFGRIDHQRRFALGEAYDLNLRGIDPPWEKAQSRANMERTRTKPSAVQIHR